MIAQNEINVPGEWANKTHNCTVSYQHCTERILEQIKWWCLCDYSILSSRRKHIWQIYVTGQLKIKSLLFLYYTRYDVNFHSCEKRIFKFFGCAKTRNVSRWTKRSRKEVIQATASNGDSWPIFPYHVHNQAGFDNY